MANSLNRDEVALLEEVKNCFDSDNTVAKQSAFFTQPGDRMQRQGDTVWREVPMICTAVDGLDVSSKVGSVTDLQVPASLTEIKSVVRQLDAQELRDPRYMKRTAKGAAQALSAIVNRTIADVVKKYGTKTVAQTAALQGYDDISLCDALMHENDIIGDKTMVLNPRDYNNMAGNLASRMLVKRSEMALSDSELGPISGFETFKTSYSPRLAAAAGSSITVDGNQRYAPAATETNSGQTTKLDNRTMNLTVNSTTNVAAGDKFTIADVNAVSLINKNDTGQLQTFTVVSVVSGTVLQIAPPVIVGDNNSDAEDDYANCSAIAGDTKALTFLNTTEAQINPFFINDSIEVFGGHLAFDDMPGVAMERMMTDTGIEIIFAKEGHALTGKNDYRLTIFYGATDLEPQANGILIGGQV